MVKVKRLSRDEIQARVDRLCLGLLGELSPYLIAYPVWQLHREFERRGWVRFVFDEPLPSHNERQIYGGLTYDTQKRTFTIRVHNGLEPWGPRFVATLSHEMGHFVLHGRYLNSGKPISYEPRPGADFGNKRFRTISQFSDRQWLEWEANEFMCALCLPRQGLAWRIAKAQNVLGIYPGLIRIDEQACNQVAAAQIISSIAMDTMIQSDLVNTRMRHFDFIVDVRPAKKPLSARDHLLAMMGGSLQR